MNSISPVTALTRSNIQLYRNSVCGVHPRGLEDDFLHESKTNYNPGHELYHVMFGGNPMNETSRRLIKRGTKEWNAWRRNHPRVEVDLSGENLSGIDARGADLRRVNFAQAKLIGANFSKADLSRVRLDGANLQQAILNSTNLEEAVVTHADLRGATLNGAQLKRAVVAGSNLEQARLQLAGLHGADLSEVRAKLADFTSAVITEVELSEADLSNARLQSADLSHSTLLAANFTQADLTCAKLIRCNLEDSVLSKARLHKASFRDSILNGADLSGADLTDADLSGVDLRNANLSYSNLSKTNLAGAKLTNANLSYAQLVEANLEGADISDCAIYGVSAWGLNLQGTRQANLVITPPGQSTVSVDNLEIAQFIYLLMNNRKIREVIDNITSKLVLVLGRFTDPRKRVLDSIRDELRRLNYVPVVLDFDKPTTRDLTETVSILAHVAKFVIADITEARSIPQELERIVPSLPSVPVQPLLESSDREYGMFEHFKKYPWVLNIYRYERAEMLIANLTEHVLKPLELKLLELKQK
ncbi:MAG TPA: pentapeptide repeat-containing protein [Candidatus Acidoferrum sp.]|nr:pentapeptide repeat-containing protein [Candidatus Acidoferrum sp.]